MEGSSMANKKVKSVVKVTNRKIARNRLKNVQGNNKIQKAWRKAQIKLYGFYEYAMMRLAKTSKNQRKEVGYRIHNGP
jgi:hypothetical protein